MTNIDGTETLAGKDDFVFSHQATEATAVELVRSIDSSQRLFFYDSRFDSPSDPGAFVSVVNREGQLFVRWNNHGWSSEWLAVSDDETVNYLWACRDDNRVGSQNRIGYLGMNVRPAKKMPPDEVVAANSRPELLLAFLLAR